VPSIALFSVASSLGMSPEVSLVPVALGLYRSFTKPLLVSFFPFSLFFHSLSPLDRGCLLFCLNREKTMESLEIKLIFCFGINFCNCTSS